MLKVCWICPNFRPPYVGGENRMFFNLFSRIISKDVEVHVITNVSPACDTVLPDGFILHGITTADRVDFYQLGSALRFLLKASWRFLRLQRRLGFDLVQMYGVAAPLGLFLSWLAKVGGCRSVFGFLFFPVSSGELKDVQLNLRGRPLWYRLLYRVAFNLPAWFWSHWLDGIIVTSHRAFSLLRDIGIDEKKIFQITPGVDLEIFCPQNGAKRPPYQIMYASSCYPWKGIFDLLDACSIVVQQGFPIQLRYVFYNARSESKASAGLIAQLEQRSAALGMEDNVIVSDGPLDSIATAMAEAHILACPLQTGIGTLGVPMSILEAMACGLPVIGTRVGGIPEVVIDDRNGYLVEPSDPQALAASIVKLLEDPARMRRMGEEGARQAARFDVQKSASQFWRMCDSLVRGQRD